MGAPHADGLCESEAEGRGGGGGRQALTLAPAALGTTPVPADAIWRLAVKDGTSYVGTGATGVIYKVTAAGEASKFCSTGEMNVTALAFDKAGQLYAATAPHGRVYRISPEGKGTLVYECGRPYLWCLTFAPDGTLYAGAGSPAAVYAISPEGTGKLVAEVKAVHVLALLLAPNGDLYAGTAGAGPALSDQAGRLGRPGDAGLRDVDHGADAGQPGERVLRLQSDGRHSASAGLGPARALHAHGADDGVRAGGADGRQFAGRDGPRTGCCCGFRGRIGWTCWSARRRAWCPRWRCPATRCTWGARRLRRCGDWRFRVGLPGNWSRP